MSTWDAAVDGFGTLCAICICAFVIGAGWVFLTDWLRARRPVRDDLVDDDSTAEEIRADAEADAFLRERFRRAREIHGMTASELADLARIETDLSCDGDLRAAVEDITERLKQLDT